MTDNEVRAIYNPDTGKMEYQEIDSDEFVWQFTIDEITEIMQDHYCNGLWPDTYYGYPIVIVNESRKQKRPKLTAQEYTK